MKELREFIKGLKRLEYEYVNMEVDDEPIVVEVDKLIGIIKDIGFGRLKHIECEGIHFISKDYRNIWIYALC